MNQISSPKPLVLVFVRASTLLFVFLSGFYTAFFSQASSSNYRQLFWSILPVAVVLFASAIFYFLRVCHWTRWAALGVAIVALVFFGEMTLRVWL
jgi:hypothetical protein